jgi:hypothetical protein
VPNNLTVSRVRVATVLWSFPLGSRYGGVSLSEGYTGVAGTGPNGNIETSGFTDPGISFHVNIFGAPALRRELFAHAIPQSSSGFHPYNQRSTRFVRSQFPAGCRPSSGYARRRTISAAAVSLTEITLRRTDNLDVIRNGNAFLGGFRLWDNSGDR